MAYHFIYMKYGTLLEHPLTLWRLLDLFII